MGWTRKDQKKIIRDNGTGDVLTVTNTMFHEVLMLPANTNITPQSSAVARTAGLHESNTDTTTPSLAPSPKGAGRQNSTISNGVGTVPKFWGATYEQRRTCGLHATGQLISLGLASLTKWLGWGCTGIYRLENHVPS